MPFSTRQPEDETMPMSAPPKQKSCLRVWEQFACNLQLPDGGLSRVEAWFSPACRNAYLSRELFAGRTDLSELHESHVNKHLTPLTSLMTS